MSRKYRARRHLANLRRLFGEHTKPWTPGGYRGLALYLMQIN